MDCQETLDRLNIEMFAFNRGDTPRNHHLIKVHRFAQMIGRMEGLDAHTQFVLECAALVHDIGIRPAEEKYGSSNGKLQEQEGPAYAQSMLAEMGLSEADVERICYLVGHHHSYDHIEGADYQILVEADFLVNFHEDAMTPAAMQAALNGIFRTASGKSLCETLYDLRPTKEGT